MLSCSMERRVGRVDRRRSKYQTETSPRPRFLMRSKAYEMNIQHLRNRTVITENDHDLKQFEAILSQAREGPGRSPSA